MRKAAGNKIRCNLQFLARGTSRFHTQIARRTRKLLVAWLRRARPVFVLSRTFQFLRQNHGGFRRIASFSAIYWAWFAISCRHWFWFASMSCLLKLIALKRLALNFRNAYKYSLSRTQRVWRETSVQPPQRFHARMVQRVLPSRILHWTNLTTLRSLTSSGPVDQMENNNR